MIYFIFILVWFVFTSFMRGKIEFFWGENRIFLVVKLNWFGLLSVRV